ncbi:hypothetical protein LCGC14_2884490 [marine sediment metagenome]|uniref:Uncharacterized protein n=1 Tax=marine sediment metagenome TaxID=412755 RepID=A0A0F9AQA2_9ZZZZ
MRDDPVNCEPRFLQSRACHIWGALIAAGASIIGGMMASDSAEDAADAQVEAARIAADVGRESIDFSKKTFDVSRADLEPYRSSGAAALGTLNSMFIPGGQEVVRMQGRLGELRARRAVLDSTLNVTAPAPAAAPAPVQQATNPRDQAIMDNAPGDADFSQPNALFYWRRDVGR